VTGNGMQARLLPEDMWVQVPSLLPVFIASVTEMVMFQIFNLGPKGQREFDPPHLHQLFFDYLICSGSKIGFAATF
jgi:hypothetical protein